MSLQNDVFFNVFLASCKQNKKKTALTLDFSCNNKEFTNENIYVHTHQQQHLWFSLRDQ